MSNVLEDPQQTLDLYELKKKVITDEILFIIRLF